MAWRQTNKYIRVGFLRGGFVSLKKIPEIRVKNNFIESYFFRGFLKFPDLFDKLHNEELFRKIRIENDPTTFYLMKHFHPQFACRQIAQGGEFIGIILPFQVLKPELQK